MPFFSGAVNSLPDKRMLSGQAIPLDFNPAEIVLFPLIRMPGLEKKNSSHHSPQKSLPDVDNIEDWPQYACRGKLIFLSICSKKEERK